MHSQIKAKKRVDIRRELRVRRSKKAKGETLETSGEKGKRLSESKSERVWEKSEPDRAGIGISARSKKGRLRGRNSGHFRTFRGREKPETVAQFPAFWSMPGLAERSRVRLFV